MSYSRDPNIPGFKYLSNVPYKKNATRLQTLDIWLPTTSQSKATPSTKSTWIIYVHGGAWRDPTQDSLCFIPTIRSLTHPDPSLLQNGHITGIASLNYRLSPYPNHASDPSDPKDVDRNVRHPEHVTDVYAALEYLVEEYKVERWIGIGHSCGATLLAQLSLVAPPSSRMQNTLGGLVLLAGIYHVPSFVENHTAPKCPENIARIYRQIVDGAFGEDRDVCEEASPTRLCSSGLWGRYVLLGYSAEDELVEPEQRDAMLNKYLEEGWKQGFEGTENEDAGKKVVEVRDLTMGHDEVWEDGSQIAQLIVQVVRRLDER